MAFGNIFSNYPPKPKYKSPYNACIFSIEKKKTKNSY